MIRSTVRTARQRHHCGCGRFINRGQRYVEHWASPNHDGMGNDGWWRIDECAECAKRYGRSVA